jgi:hypothetical protein
MTADDENPTIRWQSVRDWYDEYARDPGCEFIRPMVELADWVSQQPWADRLFAHTSLHWLCVKLEPGYHPERRSPSFACCARSDGQFECQLSPRVGNKVEKRLFPIAEAHTAFWNFVRRLQDQ